MDEREPPSGIEEPPGRDRGDARGASEPPCGPHHVLDNPVGDV